MCAIEAGKRHKNVLILDHANKAGQKILLSGGGQCNVTNLSLSENEFLSQNRHFPISALKRFSQHDTISLLQKHGITTCEREHGRLFCEKSAQDIVNMLLKECKESNVAIKKSCGSLKVEKRELFRVWSKNESYTCNSLVIATGGMSFQIKSGLGFGYNIARQFNINVVRIKAGLVPLTYGNDDSKIFSELSGIAIDAVASSKKQYFRENILFTHRGLSGPAILQVSSYWEQGDTIEIDLMPNIDLCDYLKQRKLKRPKASIISILAELAPKRLVEKICLNNLVVNKPINQFPDKEIIKIAGLFKNWSFKPNGTEGYRTAEVTVGGVDTNELSSKTMESKKVEGLYFIGEVVDVTGNLGGYNLQWAWSSGYCAGQFV